MGSEFCASCNGTGEGDRDGTPCRWCRGSGSEQVAQQTLGGWPVVVISSEVKLFRCPFCGDSGASLAVGVRSFAVACLGCGARGPAQMHSVPETGHSLAMQAWNDRVQQGAGHSNGVD